MQHSSYLHRAIGLSLCALVLLLSGIFLLHHLAQEPLQDYDEATYAEVVHEALTNHQYFSFTYAGGNDFKKPPLSFWAMIASESTLGESVFSERLPFVLFGLLLLAATMLLVYEVSKDALAAALGGAILASTSPLVMTMREVRFDAPVALFIVLAAYSAYRALTNSRWWVPFGIALGLAVLTKSVIALFALVAAALLIVMYKRIAVYKDKNLYWGVLAFAVVAVPWHVYEWAKFGNQFWASYLGQEVLARTQENLFWTVTITNADYITFVNQFVQPWLPVFWASLMALAVFWKWLPNNTKKVALASALTIACMVAVFFISKTKAPTYLIPMYPLGAVAIALMCASIKNKYAYFAAAAVGVALVVWGWQFSYYSAYYQNPYFSNVRDMARDEHAVAEHLTGLPDNEPVYLYNDDNLGAIKYYSRHFNFEALAPGMLPAGGAYILLDTAHIPDFYKTFPVISTEIVYQGPQVTLFGVLGND